MSRKSGYVKEKTPDKIELSKEAEDKIQAALDKRFGRK